jgi:hypothetical protein
MAYACCSPSLPLSANPVGSTYNITIASAATASGANIAVIPATIVPAGTWMITGSITSTGNAGTIDQMVLTSQQGSPLASILVTTMSGALRTESIDFAFPFVSDGTAATELGMLLNCTLGGGGATYTPDAANSKVFLTKLA